MTSFNTAEGVILDCVGDLNDLGHPAMAFDADDAVRNLLSLGLVERRDGGLWVTDKGRDALKEMAS